MSAHLSLRAVLRRTFGIYAEHTHVLLGAAIAVEAVLALNRLLPAHSLAAAIAAVALSAVVLGMFVCVVVLLAADARDGGSLRGARELLRGARSALGPLLLVGVLAGIALVLASSLVPLVIAIASTILVTHIGIGILAGLNWSLQHP